MSSDSNSNPPFWVRRMTPDDVNSVVAIQPLAFPPPFSTDLHWDAQHIQGHIELFPAGQFVAVSNGKVIASCSNTLIDETAWQLHANGYTTVGGPALDRFCPQGSTLYGLDIAVHPDFRRMGVARALYAARFNVVKDQSLNRYGTACRIPGLRNFLQNYPSQSAEDYVMAVVNGQLIDRTLTPLVRLGLTSLGVIFDYMMDEESMNCAALLEWIS